MAAAAGHLGVVQNIARTVCDGKEDGWSIVISEPDHWGRTCLHAAATEGHAELVKWLMEAAPGGHKQPELQHGRTPLHMAAEEGHLAVVQAIVEEDLETLYVSDHKGLEGGELSIYIRLDFGLEASPPMLLVSQLCVAGGTNDEEVAPLLKELLDRGLPLG